MKKYVQFRLKTFLALVLISSAASAFAGHIYLEGKIEQAAVSQLFEKPGTISRVSANGPAPPQHFG